MTSRALSFLCSLAIALGAGAARGGPLMEATWTTTLQGVALSVNNSGATCTDVDPATVDANGSQPVLPTACPTDGLQATGYGDVRTSFTVSLTMPLFSVNQFRTGGAIDVNTMATLQGAQTIHADLAGGDRGEPGRRGHGHREGGGARRQGRQRLEARARADHSGHRAARRRRHGPGDGFYALAEPHYLTVDFYGWTVGTRVFTGLTSKYAPLPSPTVVAMGSGLVVVPNFPSATMGVQTITLVALSKISIDGLHAQRRTASFTSLKLTYDWDGFPPVPEPGTLVLLAAGALLLGLGRRSSSH